jgi:hypothetical protein
MPRRDREILQGLVLFSLAVAGLMFAMALALSQRDLSLWECWTTGPNQSECVPKDARQ